MPRCQEEEFPPDLAAADRGPERKLVCYPTGHLGLRLIDHTPFRGTEFCAADQFSVFVYCVFFYKRKIFFNRFLESAGTWLVFIFHTLLLQATFAGGGVARGPPSRCFVTPPTRQERNRNLLAKYTADRSNRSTEIRDIFIDRSGIGWKN
jgi:hypothetical protein